MKKLYFLVALLLSLVQASHAQWQTIYPIGLYANGVFFTSDQTGYVVGSLGGRGTIIKTTTGGVSWDRLPTSTAIVSDAKAVWFTSADTGYVLTDYQLLKTTNAGASWNVTGGYLPNQVQPQGLLFTSPQVGYLTSSNGAVYKTTDAGLTWQDTQVPVTNPGGYGARPQLTFPTPQTGYLTVGFELFKTTNAGASWQRLTGVTGQNYRSVMFRSATEGYVTTTFSGAYQTTDGGSTWVGLPASWNADMVYFHNSQQGLFLSNYSNIYQTTNGGATARAAYGSRYTFSWTGIHFPTPTFGCAVGNDGAIVITRDGGATWRMHNPSTTNVRQNYVFSFSPTGQGIVGGEAAGLLRSPDNGQSWYVDEQTLPRADAYGLHFADADTGLVVTTNNYFYMTHDGGRTFQTGTGRAGAFVGHLSASDYLLLSSKVIFTTGSSVGGTARLAKSTNGGQTWSYYGPGFQNRLASLAFPTPQVGYACGAVGKVIRTTNGGTSWQEIDAPVNNDLLKIQFRTPTFGLAVGTFGGIVRTTDGGNTWTSVPSGTNFSLVAIHFVSDSVAYVGSVVGDIARTTNGGRTWTMITTPAERLPDVRKYYFRDASNTVLAMGDYALYRRDLPSSNPLSTASSAVPSKPALTLYPNPASETLTISYPDGFVPTQLRILDQRGRVVFQQSATNSRQLWEVQVGQLSAGLYVVQAEGKQHTRLTQRFIKQ